MNEIRSIDPQLLSGLNVGLVLTG